MTGAEAKEAAGYSAWTSALKWSSAEPYLAILRSIASPPSAKHTLMVSHPPSFDLLQWRRLAHQFVH